MKSHCQNCQIPGERWGRQAREVLAGGQGGGLPGGAGRLLGEGQQGERWPCHKGGREVGVVGVAGEGGRGRPQGQDSASGRPPEARGAQELCCRCQPQQGGSQGRSCMGVMEVWAARAAGEGEGRKEKGGRKGVRERISALNFVFIIKQLGSALLRSIAL